MVKTPTFSAVTNSDVNASEINAAIQAVADQFEQVLFLDGSTPNAMNADLDMNSNDILNASSVDTARLLINGSEASTSELVLSALVIAQEYATVAALLASTDTYIAGAYVHVVEGDHYYKAAASGDVTNAGGQQFEVLPADGGHYNVKAFGAVGDGVTDDTTAIQAAMDYATTQRATLWLGGGNFKITSPLRPERDLVILGAGVGLTESVLIPHDTAAFEIDGTLYDAGAGFAFNLTIQNLAIKCGNVTNAQDYIVLLRQCYTVHFDNVRIHDLNLASGSVASGIKTDGTGTFLNNTFRKTRVVGTGNTGAGYAWEFRASGGNHVLYDCTAENCYTSYFYGPNVRVSNHEPLSERNGTHHWFQPSNGGFVDGETPFVRIYGGLAKIASSSSVVLRFNGGTFSDEEIFVIDGLALHASSNDTANRNKLVNFDGTWSNKERIVLRNIDWTYATIQGATAQTHKALLIEPYDPRQNPQAVLKQNYTFQIEDLADATATEFMTLTSLLSSSPYTPVYVRVTAMCSRQGYGRAFEVSDWIIQFNASAGTPYVSGSVANDHQATASANYSITSFTVSAAADANDIDFSITSSFNTAVQTTIPDVWFEVEVWGDAEVVPA